MACTPSARPAWPPSICTDHLPGPPFQDRIAFWVKGDAGVTSGGGVITAWADQGSLHQDLTLTESGKEPGFGTDTLDGIPGVVFPTYDAIGGPSTQKYIGRSANLTAMDSTNFGLAPEHPARTIMAVIRPTNNGVLCLGTEECYQTGGPVVQFRQQQTSFGSFDANFYLQAYSNFYEKQFFLYSSLGGVYGPDPVKTTDGSVGSDYADLPWLVEWRADYPSLAVAINGGTDLTLIPATLQTNAYDGGPFPSPDGFFIGNAGPGFDTQFQGSVFEVIIWDTVLADAELLQARAYFARRYPSISIV